jgi:hypothetical protein
MVFWHIMSFLVCIEQILKFYVFDMLISKVGRCVAEATEQLLQSGISLPTSGFSPVPLGTDESGIA